jgi:hypothetical protein
MRYLCAAQGPALALKGIRRAVDIRIVTLKGLGLVSLLIALAIGGYLYAQQAKTVGPTSQVATQAEAQAIAGVAATNFQAAAPVLQDWLAEHGTYAGAALPPGYGVTVARADAVSYCLQAGTSVAVSHQVGPTGPVLPGPC